MLWIGPFSPLAEGARNIIFRPFGCFHKEVDLLLSPILAIFEGHTFLISGPFGRLGGFHSIVN